MSAHDFDMWDAAYVLGSLSATQRHEFEAHMGSCRRCRQAVAEISGMPALLSRLSPDEVAEIDVQGHAGVEPAPLRPEMLGSLLKKVTWRRRRSRTLTGVVAVTVGMAAAVVLAIGVFVAFRATSGDQAPVPPQASSSEVAMTQRVPTSLRATVSLTAHDWGTRIEMDCTYGPEADAGDKLAMVVVGRDGSRSQLATWVALSGVTASPGGATSMPIDQIASVQVVSDTGEILLQRNL